MKEKEMKGWLTASLTRGNEEREKKRIEEGSRERIEKTENLKRRRDREIPPFLEFSRSGPAL